MKKSNKLLSWIVAAAIVCNMSSVSFAAAKRDVNDPVLREIINELSKKMPKFIDKYGETVFVEDEPITRGALISAIYEYDKRIKSATETPAAGVSTITKQEFDALKAKVSNIEKSGAASAKAATPSKGGTVDMIELIADLEPNMPMILDNSLNNSKVFKSLQQQIAGGGSGKSSGKDNSKEINDMNSKIDTLAKRVDSAELGISAVVAGGKSSGKDNSSAEVNKNIADINSKIDLLTKKVDLAEASPKGAAKGQSSASAKEIDELKTDLKNIQQSYVALSKRLDALGETPAYAASPSGKTDGSDLSYINRQLSDIKKTVAEVPTANEVRKEIDRNKIQTQSDIERIEKRLNSISASSSKSSSSESGDGGSGATIATISLGITMIAALFVAR